MRRPKEELQFINEEQEICRFLVQQNISQGNLDRLTVLAASLNPEIAQIAKLVLELGKVCPRKRKRLQQLQQNHKDLVAQLKKTGLYDVCQPDF